MFIKLLTIITALFVGGVKAPPSIHKQRQTNTIKENYVERSFELINIFDPNNANLSPVGMQYYIDGDNAIVLHNFATSGELVLTITFNNFEVGHTYFFNWKLYPDPLNVNFTYYLYGFNNDFNYDRPFIETFSEGYDPSFFLQILNYNGGASEMFLYINIIDITNNPIPILDDSMEEYFTQQEVDTQVNNAITETIIKNNPLYSMNYEITDRDITYNIPIPLRENDYTHIYKSDLYNSIENRVGHVPPNNFTIKISLPMKNTRDLSIHAKCNQIELYNASNRVYSYTQGNNIFSIDLPYDNKEFNTISLSFYNFGAISANDVVLSVSNRFEETSYQEGYDKGYNVGNKDGYDKGLTDGHNEGYELGHGEGFQLGYDTGNKEGYDIGYNKGYNEGLSKEDVNPFKLVSTAFESVGKILSINVFGGITLATLIAIPFMFLVVLFILKLMKG